MSIQSQEVKDLRTALANALTKNALLEQTHGASSQQKAQREYEQRRKSFENVLSTSRREVDHFSASIELTLSSLKTVAEHSVIESHVGLITSSPESVTECSRLGKQLVDLLLARARKVHQHEQSQIRFSSLVGEAPQPATSYSPSSEGEPALAEVAVA